MKSQMAKRILFVFFNIKENGLKVWFSVDCNFDL